MGLTVKQYLQMERRFLELESKLLIQALLQFVYKHQELQEDKLERSFLGPDPRTWWLPAGFFLFLSFFFLSLEGRLCQIFKVAHLPVRFVFWASYVYSDV